MTSVLFFDAAATTPMSQEVLDSIVPILTEHFGNPSSVHAIGAAALGALDDARARVAAALGVRPGDVIFTSGGTESNNLAIKGLSLANPRGRHLVRSAIEHPSVIETCDYLVRHHGFECDVVPVEADGIVAPDAVETVLRPDTTLVTVMAVNNEVGTIQDIEAIAAAARNVGALVHTDAVQAAGWLEVSEIARHVDALSLSGHKIGGMKGGGVAMIRGKLPLEPTQHGGGQERDRRSGTENVAAAVATATALVAAARSTSAPDAIRDEELGERFFERVTAALGHLVTVTGDRSRRVPGIVSFVFPAVNGEAVLLELERLGVIASSGSACAAGSTDASHVLLALGFTEDVAHTAVRLSFSRGTTTEAIDAAADAVIEAVQRLTRAR